MASKEEVKAAIQTLGNAIDNLWDALDALEDSIDSLGEWQAEHSKKIADLDDRITELEHVPPAEPAPEPEPVPEPEPEPNPEIKLSGISVFQGEKLPAGHPATSHLYERFWVRQLMPRDGVIELELIYRLANEAKAAGKPWAFRVMACSGSLNDEERIPVWMRNKYGEITNWRFAYADFANDGLITEFEFLLSEIGKAFNGDPSLAFVDLGLFGDWGEFQFTNGSADDSGKYLGWNEAELTHNLNPRIWHFRNQDLRREYVKIHQQAFTKTRLIAIADDPIAVAHLLFDRYIGRKVGVRMDSLGDPAHMNELYHGWLKMAGIERPQDFGPVIMEVSDTLAAQVNEYGIQHVRESFAWALAQGCTCVNIKEAAPAQLFGDLANFVEAMNGLKA